MRREQRTGALRPQRHCDPPTLPLNKMVGPCSSV